MAVAIAGPRLIPSSDRMTALLVALPTPVPVNADEVIHNAARTLLGKVLTQQEETELQVEYELRASGLGGPYVEIVRYAQESDIDLIVMGTHGRGFVAHMLMGSVAEKVVRRSPCPVLTVRHPSTNSSYRTWSRGRSSVSVTLVSPRAGLFQCAACGLSD